MLRANAHRSLDGGGVEVASSPDTPRHELWRWQLRIDAAPSGPSQAAASTADLIGEAGAVSRLELAVDPSEIDGRIELVEVTAPARIDRDGRELVALVVGSGTVLFEGRHVLHAHDTLVIEGDDPLEISAERLAGDKVAVAVVRLRPVDAQRIVWVP